MYMRFVLVINLSGANAFGTTSPPSLLASPVRSSNSPGSMSPIGRRRPQHYPLARRYRCQSRHRQGFVPSAKIFSVVILDAIGNTGHEENLVNDPKQS
jgi:hypothetical protein